MFKNPMALACLGLVVGCLALLVGVGFQFGWPISLMVGGFLLILVSLFGIDVEVKGDRK